MQGITIYSRAEAFRWEVRSRSFKSCCCCGPPRPPRGTQLCFTMGGCVVPRLPGGAHLQCSNGRGEEVCVGGAVKSQFLQKPQELQVTARGSMPGLLLTLSLHFEQKGAPWFSGNGVQILKVKGYGISSSQASCLCGKSQTGIRNIKADCKHIPMKSNSLALHFQFCPVDKTSKPFKMSQTVPTTLNHSSLKYIALQFTQKACGFLDMFSQFCACDVYRFKVTSPLSVETLPTPSPPSPSLSHAYITQDHALSPQSSHRTQFTMLLQRLFPLKVKRSISAS